MSSLSPRSGNSAELVAPPPGFSTGNKDVAEDEVDEDDADSFGAPELSPYDLLDIHMLKEIDPSSVEEVACDADKDNRRTTLRRSFNDDEDILAAAAVVAKSVDITTDVVGAGSVSNLEWDMEPSMIHRITKNSEVDTKMMEQKMQSFLFGDGIFSSSASNRRASIS